MGELGGVVVVAVVEVAVSSYSRSDSSRISSSISSSRLSILSFLFFKVYCVTNSKLDF